MVVLLTALGAAEAAPALRLVPLPDGRLLATKGGVTAAVFARLTFPWTEPTRFVSLRDADEAEFALVTSAAELDGDSRAALELALAQAGFVLQITRVLHVEDEVEVRHWEVETRQGHRKFQTRLDDWPRELPAGGLLIRDVGGDLYHIAEPAAMDEKSRELLWAFVD